MMAQNSVVAFGLGLATVGAVLLSVDAIRLLRMDTRREAEIELKRDYAAFAPEGEQWSKELGEKEKQVGWRKWFYASGVLLLLTGFVVQTIGILLP